MNLLILPAYFFPESMSSSLLDEHRYQAFMEEGFMMDVYTPLPTRGVTKDVWKEYHKKKEETLYDHHMVVRRFSLMREGQNPVLRAFRYFLAFIKQYRYGMRANNVDCVYLVSTPPIQGLIGAFMKKKKHIPFVYNVQDIFPDSLVGSGLAKKNGFLWRLGSYITRFTYKYCDRIIVISQDFKNNLLSKGVPENKIEVIYNWVDEDKVYPVEDSMNPLFDEFNITRSKFRVVYAGNLGNAQNIDILIDAASRLKNSDNIEFIISQIIY